MGKHKKTHIGERQLSPETQMMSYGYDPMLSEGAVKPPVFLSSTYVFKDAQDGEDFFNVMSGRVKGEDGNERGGLIYGRFNHPNVEIIEDRLSLWEESETSVVFASGMGAISGVLFNILRPGDVILHSTPLYGGTETLIGGLLPQFGITAHPFPASGTSDDMQDAYDAASAKGNVKMIFVETPSNPTNDLVDLAAVKSIADTAEKNGKTRPVTVCDNTMMGPVFQTVCPQGIDIALYSLTKYIGGHSDLIAGAICGSKTLLEPIRRTRGAMGFNLDPHTAWMIGRSMETLSLRMERSGASAEKIAEWIANNPYSAPEAVLHFSQMDDARIQDIYKRQCRGAGSTFAFRLNATKTQMFAFIDALKIFKSAVSLGGTESLICHPSSTTHSGVPLDVRQATGVTDGLVRMSIGIENVDDLIADIDQAMKAVFG